jgi:endonuclease/exonuclease/phosphatase family metal-dependent hydrolase
MQVDLIRKYDPDIIGTQEGLKEQVDYLMDHLPEYVVIGEGRKGGDDDEHMAIFLKRDKFRLREMHSFQLSETPEVIGSGPAVNPRMVTWARIAYINRPSEMDPDRNPMDYRGHWKETKEFYFFNTHYFDRRDQTLARVNASKLILERISALDRFGEWTTERPVFLVGDFNCRPGSPPHSVLVGGEAPPGLARLKDAAPGGNGIDWILYKGSVEVLKHEEVRYDVGGVLPSDHNPLLVEFRILED